MPIRRECKICSKIFHVPPSRLRASSCNFCSSKCRAKAWEGKGNPHWKGGLVDRACELCNKAFQVKAKQVRNGWGKFCSRSCARIAYGKIKTKLAFEQRIVKCCIVCGGEFRLKPSHAKKRGKYCSYDCMGVDYKERLIQDKNPNYRHGESGTLDYINKMSKKWRNNNKDKIKITNRNTKAKRNKAEGKHTQADINFLYLFQKGKCIACRISLKGGYHVDHIQPIALGSSNYKTNLQLLCPPCNLNKRAKDPIVFMQSKGFLL